MPEAVLQGFGKAFFLLPQRAFYERDLFVQAGETFAHNIGQGFYQLVKKRFVESQLVTMANSAADDPAQYVAAAFIGRNHTVGDEKGARADMIGDHAGGNHIELLLR